MQHLGLIRYHAHRFASKTRQDWYDDFVGAGHLGLMEAAISFEVAKGRDFGRYASPRIQGAMWDYLRQQDPLKRCQRDKVKAGEMADVGTVQSWESLIEAQGDRVQILQDDPSDPMALVLDRVEQEQVRAALRQLPEQQASVLYQYYFQGKTYAAIGRELGQAGISIYHIAERSLKRLRVLLDDPRTEVQAVERTPLHSPVVSRHGAKF